MVRMDTRVRGILLVAALALLPGSPARADGYLESASYHSTLFTVGWDAAAPIGKLRTGFIDRRSYTGLGLGLRFGQRPQLSVGGDFTWNRFSQASPDGGGDRTLDAFTARLTLHRYFTTSAVQPYIGGGIGGVWREAGVGGASYASGIGACIAPEIGLLLTFGRGIALDIAARYELTTANVEFTNPPVSAKFPQWIGVHVGFGVY